MAEYRRPGSKVTVTAVKDEVLQAAIEVEVEAGASSAR